MRPFRFGTSLAESLDEGVSIIIVVEYGFTPVATIDDMVNGAGILEAQLSRQGTSKAAAE